MAKRSFARSVAVGLGLALLCTSIPTAPAEAGPKKVFAGVKVSQGGEKARKGKMVFRKKSGGRAKLLIKCKKCGNKKIRGAFAKVEKGMYTGTATMGGSQCTASVFIFAGTVDAFGDCGSGGVFSVYRGPRRATD